MKIVLNKILNSFVKHKEPCFYMHVDYAYGRINPNSSHYRIDNLKRIFFNTKLNNNEYKSKNKIDVPKIWSVYQGKRLFYRFLKENNFFSEFLHYNSVFRYDINYLIKNEFINPFYQIMHDILIHYDERSPKHKIYDDLRKMKSLSVKWINILKSVGYKV